MQISYNVYMCQKLSVEKVIETINILTFWLTLYVNHFISRMLH